MVLNHLYTAYIYRYNICALLWYQITFIQPTFINLCSVLVSNYHFTSYIYKAVFCYGFKSSLYSLHLPV